MRKMPEYIFEFKTKSDNIDSLLQNKAAKNVVIAWSLNPQEVIDQNEFYSASLIKRLKAAKKCAEAGYKVAFHYDPIIYYSGWEQAYSEVIEKMFKYVKTSQISWISM